MPPLVSLAELLQKRTDYVGSRVRVTASINTSLYYNYGYRKAQETHAAFRLTDGPSTGYAYAPRGSDVASGLNALATHSTAITRELTVFIDPAREKGRGLVVGEIEAVGNAVDTLEA